MACMATTNYSTGNGPWRSGGREGEAGVFPIAKDIALIGAAVFTAISVIEALPFLGMLGGIAEVLLWIGMAGLFVHRAKAALCELNSPALASLGWGAALGAATAVAGVAASLAVTVTLAFAAALLLAGTGYRSFAPLVAFSGSGPIVGTLLSFLWWPPLGAGVCGLAALLCGGAMVPHRVRADLAYQPPANAASRGTAAEPPWWREPSEGPPPARTTEMPVSPDGRYYWDGTSWRPTTRDAS